MVNSISLRNPIRRIFNNLMSQGNATPRVRKSQYKLLEKTKKLPVEDFPVDSWALPTDAVEFTRVRIGKKSDKDFQREVVTFYDKNGDMIRRCFKGTGIKNKIREYGKEFLLARKGIELNGACGVNKRTIKTTEFYGLEDIPSAGVWKTTSDEEQFIYSMFDKTKGYRSAKKLHINKNQYDYEGEKAHVKATCVEYPINLGFENPKDKKVLSMNIGIDINRVKVEGVNSETNVEVPLKDEFLPYRMLVGDRKQECLAQHFLDEKGVGDMGIRIETNKSKVNENAAAYFSSDNQEIVFKRVQKYGHPVITSSHEAEHAYQHCMIGRAGKGKTYYERKCRWEKGGLSNPEEIEEARKYSAARADYPIVNPKEDLSQNKDYQENYLEVMARAASKKATEMYDIGRQKLLNIFKYVGGYSSL